MNVKSVTQHQINLLDIDVDRADMIEWTEFRRRRGAVKRPIVWSHACRDLGKPVEASERPRFRARKGRSLVIRAGTVPTGCSIDGALPLSALRLSALMMRAPCRSVMASPGHCLQAAS